jgi:two-component system, sensor histidine kinase FlrB
MNARIAAIKPAGGTIQGSGDLQAAFALFNQVSAELTDSYRCLERRVEELASELEQVDGARLRELEAKERLSQRLQSLLDLLPAGVIVLDRDGVVCDGNPAAREMLGENPVASRWGEVIKRCFAPRPDDGHEISLQSGRRVSVETRSLERDCGQLVLLTDQTETRELQDRLSRHQRLTAMGRMMAALAHQIRTPLSAALLYASNLCREEPLSGEQTRRFSQKILARLSHMEQQVKDMLIFVRHDVPLENRCTVSELSEQIIAAMEAPLVAYRASCDVALECNPLTEFTCNREALIGAILNLINNGLQASGEGARIELQFALRADRLCITVADRGDGMDEATLRQMEEEFFTTKPQGNGLGIAVVRAVARAHRGRLEFFSQPRQGTRATLLLPLDPTNEMQEESNDA